MAEVEKAVSAALAAYGLEGARVHPLSTGGINAVFRIDGSPAGREGTYALRICRRQDYGVAMTESELTWLVTLRRDAGLLVPEPVPAVDGAAVVRLPAEGRHAVLFHWLPGQAASANTSSACRRIGEFMARLHRHSERFAVPADFVRPRYDLDRLLGQGEVVPPGTGEAPLSPNDRSWLDEAAQILRREIQPLGQGRDIFGLIHGDLQVTNYLFHQGAVGAIDFADFGWGYYLYDVAASLLPVWEEKDFPALKDAFLRGYRRIRPLTAAHEAYLEPLALARGIFVVRWTVEHWDHPAVRESGHRIVPHVMGQVRRFLDQRSPERKPAGQRRTAAQLLSHLRGLGIRLWEEDGRLRFKAPRGALSPALRTELSQRKAEVLAFLRQTTAGGSSTPAIPRIARDGDLPLSFAQQRLWVLHQFEPASPAYNVAQALRLRGALRPEVLARCFAAIVDRHESLRTVFPTRDGKPVQRILPPRRILPLVDLRTLAEGRRRAEAKALADAETMRPFDLATGPLIRFTLLRLSVDEHLLLLTLHHIISDGWSSGVLIRELAALYEAYGASGPSPLAELPIQYADFASWQRGWLRGEVLENLLAYWRRQLAGAPNLLALPTDRPRPPAASYAGDRLHRTLPTSLSESLRAFSRGHGATLFMTLLAAFKALLHRYTGRREIVVGSPIANRNRAEIEGLIGFFVNTLVLRADFSPRCSFRELLEQVREVTLGAYAHQDLPFEKLVDALQPERTVSYSPLFQVCFGLQNAPQSGLRIPGLILTFEDPEKATAKFDLTLDMWETEKNLSATFNYTTDLFDRPTIQRLAWHFVRLLEFAVTHPDRPLGEAPLLSVAQRQQLVREWNDTRVCFAHQELCVHELFAAQAQRTPEAVAVICERRRWSYRHLDRQANRLAHHLRALGVGPEVMVAVCLERSAELVTALLGIFKAGGVYVPLDPSSPPERLERLLGNARPAVVVTRGGLPAIAVPGLRVVDLVGDGQAIAAASDTDPGPMVGADHLAYMIFTSGSTGEPKGVLCRHRGLTNRLLWMQEPFRLGAEDRVLQKTSSTFDVSLWELLAGSLAGAGLVLARPGGQGDPAYLARLMAAERVTLCHFVPSMLQVFLDDPRAGSCGSVRRVVSSGEALPGPLARRFPERFPGDLFNLYGPTEASIEVTWRRCERDSDRATVPIGRPIANTGLRVLDRRLRPVPVGVPGELHLGGVSLARGYFNRPALTAQSFVPDPLSAAPGARLYRSGDLARYLPDGDVEFLGRLDHQIKVRGFRVEPGEIEAVLRQHPGVREAVVAPQGEGQMAGKQLVAYLVAVPGELPSTEQISRFLRRKLPSYMVPTRFVTLEKMPLNPSGKVDRAALQAAGGRQLQSEIAFVAARNPVEEKLVAIWCELLEVGRIGIHDVFFNRGGNSLLATQVVSRVRETFRVELPLASFFEQPTVAELAASIESAHRAGEDHEARGVEPPAIVPVPRDRELPLSFAQQRLWFLDVLHPGSPAFNIPAAVRLKGSLAPAVLERAFNEIVRRHEALRTTFPAEDGRPRQVIAPQLRLRLPVVDLRRLAPGDRTREARRLVRAEARRPFDLSSGPLVRVSVVELGKSDHVLMITIHHIVSDGWSMVVFQRELVAIYEAFLQGRPSPLPALPVHYADFAHWQQQWLQGEVLDGLVSYWKNQLAGNNELELFADRQPRPAGPGRGGNLPLGIRGPLLAALRTLSREQGGTVFITLLAAFQTLLHRYTGQDDVVVGAPVANRNRTQIEGLIGFFVNTLVLRGDLSGNPTFREFLGRVEKTAVGAYDHQDLPFEHLVRILHPERNLDFQPLYTVMFAYQERPRAGAAPSGVTLSPLDLPDDREPVAEIRHHLIFNLAETAEGVTGEVGYNADLFDRSTVVRFLRHWRVLLETIAADPEQRVGDLPLLSASERHQLVVEWSGGWLREDGTSPLDHLWEGQTHRLACAPADLRVYVLDSHRRSTPIGVRGEIGLAGPGSVIGEDLYPTGARGRYLHDGNLELSGQVDQQITRPGLRSAPGPEVAPPVRVASDRAAFAPTSRKEAILARRAELARRRRSLTAQQRELLESHLREE